MLDLRRLAPALTVAAILGVAATATAAPAAPRGEQKMLGKQLGLFWKQVLALPADSSPLAGNGDPCVQIGRDVVAPVVEPDAPAVTCTVKPGTKILVVGFGAECSDVEPAPFNAATYAGQAACAHNFATGVTNARFTVDGRTRPLAEVVTPPERVLLPTGNVLTGVAGIAHFAADDYTGLAHPLAPGSHTLTIHQETVPGFNDAVDITFYVNVARPAHDGGAARG